MPKREFTNTNEDDLFEKRKKINEYVHISPHNITLDKILETMPNCDVISNSDLMWAKISGLYNIIGTQNNDGTYNSVLLYTNPSPIDTNLPYIKQLIETDKYRNLRNEIKIHALCAVRGKGEGKKLIESFINEIAPKDTLIYLQPSESNLKLLEKYYKEKVQPHIKKIDSDFFYDKYGIFIWIT